MRALCLLIVFAAMAAIAAPVAAAGSFTYKGTVSRIVDGDTLVVELKRGKRERVRIIGINAPERGQCFYREATERASSLALLRSVTLKGDRTQATRDRYRRLLAYVLVRGKSDVGRQLIAGGFGRVFVFDALFARLGDYRAREDVARKEGRGMWGACGALRPPVTPPTVAPPPPPPPPASAAICADGVDNDGDGLTDFGQDPGCLDPSDLDEANPLLPPTPPPPPPPPSGGCHPNYSPCLPIVGDLDCGEISDSLKPIRIIGADPYRLDGDGDGLGCE